MSEVERSVFLCYRRTQVSWALAIFQDLTSHGYDVFLDQEALTNDDFEEKTLENVRNRKHFLVLLTRDSLERARDAEDWVRKEIQEAINSQRNIIPLFMDGFDLENSRSVCDDFPSLSELFKINYLRVHSDYFPEAMERLREKYLLGTFESAVFSGTALTSHKPGRKLTRADTSFTIHHREIIAQGWFQRALDSSEPDERIRCLSEALRNRENFGEAYWERAKAFAAIGNLKDSIGDLNKVILYCPYLEEAYYERARQLCLERDFGKALLDFQKCMELRPERTDLYGLIGSCFLELKKYADAVWNISESFYYQSITVAALKDRSYAKACQKNFAGALADIELAEKIDKDDSTIKDRRGELLEQLGRLDEAVECYSQLPPERKSPSAKVSHARCLFNLGEKEACLRLVTNEITLLRSSKDCLVIAAKALLDLGRPYECITFIDLHRTTESDSKALNRIKGHCYENLGEHRTALSCYVAGSEWYTPERDPDILRVKGLIEKFPTKIERAVRIYRILASKRIIIAIGIVACLVFLNSNRELFYVVIIDFRSWVRSWI